MRIFLVFFAFAGFIRAEYRPLSRKDKKAFKRAAQAIVIAKREQNTDAILRFAPGLLKKNESLLLDPDSKQLRKSYRLIESIYEAALLNKRISEAAMSFRIKKDGGGDSIKILAYQDYLGFLKSENLDSLFEFHSEALFKYQAKYLRRCNEVSCLRFLSSLRYYDKSLWLEYSKKMDVSIQRDFVEITNSLDRDKIMEFKKNYPGIYEQDVNSLLEKSRQHARLSLMKHPSVDGILSYFGMYKVEDKPLKKKLEQILYSNWRQYSKIEDAERYVRYFPNTPKGRRLSFWIEEERRYLRGMYLQKTAGEDTASESNL